MQKIGPSFFTIRAKTCTICDVFKTNFEKVLQSFTVYIPIIYYVIQHSFTRTYDTTVIVNGLHLIKCSGSTGFTNFFCFLAYNLFPHFFSFFKKGSVLFFTGTELNPLYQSYFVLRVIQLRNANLDIRTLTYEC